MTKPNDIQPPVEALAEANLDQVVGGGVIVHDATGDTFDARKQEHSEKLDGGQP